MSNVTLALVAPEEQILFYTIHDTYLFWSWVWMFTVSLNNIHPLDF